MILLLLAQVMPDVKPHMLLQHGCKGFADYNGYDKNCTNVM